MGLEEVDLRHGGEPDLALSRDAEIARDVAAEAGRLLVALRETMAGVGASELRAEGDARSHRLIIDRISSLRPDDAILSEEGKDDRARLQSRRVWVVDPLDGTREFGEPPRDDWAVHVGLCVDGLPVAGAVALPARSLIFSTDDRRQVGERKHPQRRIVASRSRAPALLGAIAERLDAEVAFMGSAGAKTMAVVQGEADAYVHAGGQYEWDSAAPVAVALAAGFHCSRIDGSPLLYNQPDPYLPDLLVCRPELANALLVALRGAEGETGHAGPASDGTDPRQPR